MVLYNLSSNITKKLRLIFLSRRYELNLKHDMKVSKSFLYHSLSANTYLFKINNIDKKKV